VITSFHCRLSGSCCHGPPQRIVYCTVFEIPHLRLISLSGRRRVVRAMNSSNSTSAPFDPLHHHTLPVHSPNDDKNA
jgi:hypothetical protein